jgi:hypothetical protein
MYGQRAASSVGDEKECSSETVHFSIYLNVYFSAACRVSMASIAP